MKPTMLIVDDDEEMIELYSVALGRDYTIVAERSGVRALPLAEQHTPDAVLLDLHMPNVDGYEVLSQLANHPVTASIPVICASADTTGDSRERVARLGAVGFIPKPPKLKQLAADVRGFLAAINSEVVAADRAASFLIAHNERHKRRLMTAKIEMALANVPHVLLLGWDEGDVALANDQRAAIDDGRLCYLQIKPSLITKFPYMQDLSPLLADIHSLIGNDANNWWLLFDEPNLLFGQTEGEAPAAKAFALRELLDRSFAQRHYLASRKREGRADQLIRFLAGTLVPRADRNQPVQEELAA